MAFLSLSACRGRGAVGLGWPRLLEAAYTTTNALVVRMKVRVFTSNINDIEHRLQTPNEAFFH